MRKEFSLPKDMLKTKIDEFNQNILDYLDNTKPNEIIFNFSEVNIVVSYSIHVITRLIKTISVLGINVYISQIPSHLALPLSQFLESIPNVTFVLNRNNDTTADTSKYDWLFESRTEVQYDKLISRGSDSEDILQDIMGKNNLETSIFNIIDGDRDRKSDKINKMIDQMQVRKMNNDETRETNATGVPETNV